MQSPPHIYKEPGSYTVSLTVKNVRGESKLVRSSYIVAGTVPTPTPLPSASPSLTATPEPWPTGTPTAKPTGTATAAASPTPKPTPGMGWLIGISALAIACPAILKIKGR
jgi:PKD repeat protein